MTPHLLLRAALFAGCAVVPSLAHAQTLSAQDAAALRSDMEALKAQMQALQARLDKAESGAASAAASAQSATTTAQKAVELANKAGSAPTIKFKGAPEISDGKGWSFKPRGRFQWDVASVNAPDGVNNTALGFSNKLRRAFLGFGGTIPGGFGYRLEADLANSSVTLTDAYITYDRGPLNVTLGQHKPFGSLDELTSDLDTSLLERAAFVQAFGFERRLGLSFGYATGDVMLNAGVFTDDIKALSSTTAGADSNNSYSVDTRLVWMPKLDKVQLHIGGSLHMRDMNSLSTIDSEYRARPGTGTTDVRFITSGKKKVNKEFGAGLELAAVSGPIHAAAETYWFRPELAPSGRDAHLFGGYAEVGYMLTEGDTRSYKKGVFGAVSPTKPVGKGGMGAVQIVARYDYLDLNDPARGITGGTQKGYYAGLNWFPVEYIKLMLNYGHIDYSNVAVTLVNTTNGDRSYGVDTLAARAQLSF